MANAKESKRNDFLAKLLRRDILSGEFHAGEWLKQADIEDKYDANRFEVRMALSELSARKIIEHTPNRGYRVIKPTDKEREELFEVRTVLEVAASKLAIRHATDSDINALEMLVEEFEEAIETKGKDELLAINVKFHETFYALSKNNLLSQQITELRDRGTPGRQGGWDKLIAIRTSSNDHRQMVEMLKKRDAEGMASIVYIHLNRWREYSSPRP